MLNEKEKREVLEGKKGLMAIVIKYKTICSLNKLIKKFNTVMKRCPDREINMLDGKDSLISGDLVLQQKLLSLEVSVLFSSIFKEEHSNITNQFELVMAKYEVNTYKNLRKAFEAQKDFLVELRDEIQCINN